MKVILQPEARTISNKELLDNSDYLINLFVKISLVKSIFVRNSKSKIET